ncbi:MAG: HNH endonuclease, partial [Nitrospira sp.]|nr:HNH endonuclease [Nitrospira sp.]
RRAYTTDQKPFRYVYYNALLDLDAPFLLVLSACGPNDPEEDEKIRTIAREIDRYFSLLQLQSAYDSNEFADSLVPISEAIRGKGLAAIRPAFDAQLTAVIAARRNVKDAEPLSYAAFKQTGINLNTRFKRYFFARIDEFLAENMNLNPKHPIADLVTKTGAKAGFHVEHILSWNEENKSLFNGEEERFEQERNRLGGILLLKGKDNISSNNEPYRDKLKSYANTLYWNETLRSDSYKSKLDMAALKNHYGLDLEPLDSFGPDDLEARHKLLFKLVGIIWN